MRLVVFLQSCLGRVLQGAAGGDVSSRGTPEFTLGLLEEQHKGVAWERRASDPTTRAGGRGNSSNNT